MRDGAADDHERYCYDNLPGSRALEVNSGGELISQEEYYPYGVTALFAARSQLEAGYKTIRFSGKEQDATGLYYYGYRYYQPWAGRWLSADPAGTVDGINIYQMVNNNPIVLSDDSGLFSFKWWGISPAKRANLSYQRMAEGELWSGFSDYASFLQQAKQNLKDIKSANKVLSPEAADFINRFQRIDFNLVHFSNADLSKGVFYSRVELGKKK